MEHRVSVAQLFLDFTDHLIRHWLDVAEFIVAFSYAYDWMYDAWTDTQRDAIMWSIITLGLDKGMDAYTQDSWFLSVHGNWNCEFPLKAFPNVAYVRL